MVPSLHLTKFFKVVVLMKEMVFDIFRKFDCCGLHFFKVWNVIALVVFT